MKKVFKFLFILNIIFLVSCVAPKTLIKIIIPEETIVEVNEVLDLDVKIYQNLNESPIWSVSNENAEIDSNGVIKGLSEGEVVVSVKYGGDFDQIVITIIDSLSIDDIEDPYQNISKEDFYLNYKPAENFVDAYYRTQHGLMSGSIDEQDQEPTVSSNRPIYNGMYIKNSNMIYSNDGNTYTVIDHNGNEIVNIYKDGAYITLEEVAAYIFAFNTVPPNYSSSKKTKPNESIWGKYLRVNHSNFSGDTSRYPYEPELPNISGCGGEFYYYETDIGTTGTDCDPKYIPTVYNNGSKITRGAARIVYSKYDLNRNDIIEVEEKHLFYTYNHYNDFQEYLNYYNGWGDLFGNITGGGVLSSKTNYNPTPYLEVYCYKIKEES